MSQSSVETDKALEAAAEPHAHEQRTGYHIDTRYPRSLEGVVRIISWPLAIVAFVVSVFGFQGGVGGIYYAATGNFVVHILVVFVIEIFIPRICMHRLADACISFFHALLWLASAIVSTVYAVKDYRNNRELLVAAAVLAYVLTGSAVVSGVLAFYTWKKHGNKCGNSKCGNSKCGNSKCGNSKPLCGD